MKRKQAIELGMYLFPYNNTCVRIQLATKMHNQAVNLELRMGS